MFAAYIEGLVMGVEFVDDNPGRGAAIVMVELGRTIGNKTSKPVIDVMVSAVLHEKLEKRLAAGQHVAMTSDSLFAVPNMFDQTGTVSLFFNASEFLVQQ